MNSDFSAELAAYVSRARKTSRIAAFGTAIDAILVLSSLAYATWKLADRRRELEITEATIEAKKAELKKVQDELNAKSVSLEAAREDKYAFAGILEKVPSDAVDGATLGFSEQLRIGAHPHADATFVTQSGNLKLYDFRIHIDFTDEGGNNSLKSKIRRVVYHFDDPSFVEKEMSSTDSAGGFEVGYRGWGALHDVVIEYEHFNGERVRTDFYMHDALKRQNIQIKGEIPRKG